MFRKFCAATASLLIAAAITAGGFATAEAGHRRHIGGAAIGLFALGALGAQSEYGDSRDRCYSGRRECRWVRGDCYRDRYGNFECEESYRECYRPRYCD